MSERRLTPRDYMEHLLDSCAAIRQFINGKSQEEFLSDRMAQDATIRNIEVLGEASRQLRDVLPDAATRFPAIPFNAMYVTRNRLIHGYSSLRMETIWEAAVNEIPVVYDAVTAALAAWPEDLE